MLTKIQQMVRHLFTEAAALTTTGAYGPPHLNNARSLPPSRYVNASHHTPVITFEADEIQHGLYSRASDRSCLKQ